MTPRTFTEGPRDVRLHSRDAPRWGVSALISALAHGALFFAFTPAVPDGAADAAAPPVVMIDLAPEPVAPAVAAPEPVEDRQALPERDDAPADPPATPEADADPPDPGPDPRPALLEPVSEPQAPRVEAVAAPDPQPRPEPPRERREPQIRPEKKTAERHHAPHAELRAASKPAEPVAAAPMAAAAGSSERADWAARLAAHLERRKRYPTNARANREEGVAMVRFSIGSDGAVLSVALASSSGRPDLDEEALALVRRASPVPAPPSGGARTVTAPIRFSLR